MEPLLLALKAAAEPTRLRLLALCAHGELTVRDLTQILGQSQPRVSRHLKLLSDAGLMERFREGTWAYFRLAQRGEMADLASKLVAMVSIEDPVLALDLERLKAIRLSRTEAAAAYFRDNAQRWDILRSLHVPEQDVEAFLLSLLPAGSVQDLLDIGTGTGRILELFAPRVRHAVGIDSSREMLAVARARLDQADLTNCQVRLGDMYQLPLPSASFDAAILHQVLHYAEEPARVIGEAARVLKPHGRLVIVDFSRHAVDSLQSEHAHRRLGFDDDEVLDWCLAAGLTLDPIAKLPGDPLTVVIWTARRALAPAAVPQPNLLKTGVA